MVADMIDTRPAEGGRLMFGTRFAVGAMVILTVLVHYLQPMPSDIVWLLVAAERLLEGQQLYVDVLETNPPMTLWLYMPSVWLAALTGIKDEIWLTLIVTGVTFASLGSSARILNLRAGSTSWSAWWVFGLGALLVTPVASFAQKEHFALLFVLPMLCLIAHRLTDGKTALGWMVLAGIGGGLCMAVKPQFALAILLPAIMLIWRRRSLMALLQPEYFVAAAVVLAYWAIVAVGYPAFFAKMMPDLVLAYGPVKRPIYFMLLLPHMALFWLCFIALATVYRRSLADPVIGVMFAAAVGFLLAYLHQAKGWPYHLLPGTALLTMALAMAFLKGREPKPDDRPSGIDWVLAGLLLSIPGMVGLVHFGRDDDKIIGALRPYGPGLTYAAITPDLGLANPLHRILDGTYVNRAPAQLLASGANYVLADQGDALSSEDRSALRAIEQRELTELREDLATNPDVILAMIVPGDEEGLGWARKDPAIARQLDAYQEIGTFQRLANEITVFVAPGLKPMAP